jgi:site-specific DNA recombinase
MPKPRMTEVYKAVIQDEFRTKTKAQREDVKQVKVALEKANGELANARKLILSGDIDPSEYRLIKTDYEKKITGLESKLMELSKESSNIEPLLDKAIATLSSLDKLYEKANNQTKREIIGSIFPEKLVFDGLHYRTARLNEAVSLIYSMDKAFSENKNGQNHQNLELSSLVTRPGFEPRQAESESAVLPLYYRALKMQI